MTRTKTKQLLDPGVGVKTINDVYMFYQYIVIADRGASIWRNRRNTQYDQLSENYGQLLLQMASLQETAKTSGRSEIDQCVYSKMESMTPQKELKFKACRVTHNLRFIEPISENVAGNLSIVYS